jgi:hypothetical protein
MATSSIASLRKLPKSRVPTRSRAVLFCVLRDDRELMVVAERAGGGRAKPAELIFAK